LRGFFFTIFPMNCSAICALRQLARNASLVLLVLAGGAAESAETADPAIAPFSAGSPGSAFPAPWRIVTLPKPTHPTQYTLAADAGTTVLRAQANAAMASLVHPLKLDPKTHPFISWRWKISNLLDKADISTRAGDDFPARVYVVFDYDVGKLSLLQRIRIFLARKLYGREVPAAALCYVWDGKAPVGTSVWSPYTDRVRVIVVESGAANIGRWREEERDLVADFRAAFGEEPPEISGVAVASDTDNTGESVTAWFGDIRLSARPQKR
jgi:hypothetical protein